MKKVRRPGQSGLTLIEVIIASIILAAVMFMSYSVLLSTTSTSAQGELTLGLENRGKKFIERCKAEFYDARFNDTANSGILGIHDNHTQVHYQVALRQNNTGAVDYGYVGASLVFVDPVTGVPSTASNAVPNYTPWVGCSCVIRFEPEQAVYEASFASLAVVQPSTTDAQSPQTWKANSYTGTSLAPGTTLPRLFLDKDVDGDGLKNTVYVRGKIWKYVMNAAGTAALTAEQLDDDVLLAVQSDGTFQGNVDAQTGTPAGKDWLFRWLLSEPVPPTTYGNTDTAWLSNFPGPNAVAMMVTVWHGKVDDSGKRFVIRKSWERVPFRLSKLTGS